MHYATSCSFFAFCKQQPIFEPLSHTNNDSRPEKQPNTRARFLLCPNILGGCGGQTAPRCQHRHAGPCEVDTAILTEILVIADHTNDIVVIGRTWVSGAPIGTPTEASHG